ISAGIAAGKVRARRLRHGQTTFLLQYDFHFLTLHDLLLRDTQLRRYLRLDPEYDSATCPRLLRAPRNFFYCSSIAASRLRLRCMAFLPRLLADFFLQQIAQPGSRLMQLRFRISYRTTHDSSNLVVLVALDIVQHEHRAIPGRQPVDRAF